MNLDLCGMTRWDCEPSPPQSKSWDLTNALEQAEPVSVNSGKHFRTFSFENFKCTDGRDLTAKDHEVLLWEKEEHIDGKHGISGWSWCVTASSYATAYYSFCKLRVTSSQNINFVWLMVWPCSFFPCANHYWSILLWAGLLTTCKWSIHWMTAYKIISAYFFRHRSLRFTLSPFFMVMHHLRHLPLLPLPDCQF